MRTSPGRRRGRARGTAEEAWAAKARACSLSPARYSYYATAVDAINGKPVTEQDIRAWADEAERGYDVAQLRKRGRRPAGDGPGQVVPVRLDATLLAALAERAERDHVSRSEAIRAAIRAYVA
jgi:hypothetical protein